MHALSDEEPTVSDDCAMCNDSVMSDEATKPVRNSY